MSLKTKLPKFLFITYALLSVIFILIINRSILSSIPTVQEKAYGRWFDRIEPLLWTSDENRPPLPAIVISTPSTQYICASKEYGCTVSLNQEQILRYLRLIQVSKAMRFSRPSQQKKATSSGIEIRIYQGIRGKFSRCENPLDSKTDSRNGLGDPLFSGITVEENSSIIFRNFLSLVQHSCFKVPD
jgi:hypothetical protein